MAKKRSPVGDYALYLLVRVVVCIVQALSWSAALALARGFAWLAYRINRRHRLVAADNVRVALVGPGASLKIGREDPLVIPAGQSATLPGGEIFQVVVSRHSACCYLAVEGGIAGEPVYGSLSVSARAYVLMRGSVVLEGDPKTLAASPQLKDAYLGMAREQPSTETKQEIS